MRVIVRKESESHWARDPSRLINPVFLRRSEPTNDDESNSAKDSIAKYLSEDSRDSEDPEVDLESAVKQLQEFIPDIKDRAATTIKRMYRDDLGRFKEFKAQGEFVDWAWMLVRLLCY